ncbi:carbohydrate esterase family 3 protein [Cadophora sp. DSE1049]|nr:carbohydrate esterase family 3 protein [Cadophora sp. DSE1049]
MRLLKLCVAVLWIASTTNALHHEHNKELFVERTEEPNQDNGRQQKVKRGLSNNITLRILTLGASIAYGYPSTSGNGFRNSVRNKLVWDGNLVNMVGTVKAGSMADNDMEAWGGYLISEVAAKAENSIKFQPNLILLHVGTNDMIHGIDVANAHNRLATLIDRLFATIPGVTILASTLLPTSVEQARGKIFNANLPAMVKTRQAAGKKILLVDMSSSFFSMADITADGIHPTDAGYEKMAAVWYQGISAASSRKWLVAPTRTSFSDVVVAGNTCDKTAGNEVGPYQIDAGSGRNDGDYVHSAVAGGGYLGVGNPAPSGVNWADINGDGLDDYIYVSSNLNGGLGVALNTRNGVMGPYLRVTTSPGSCLRSGVRFADMTGDGRSDLCCLAANGDLNCWKNTVGSDARSPNWVSMGYLIRDKGYTQDYVRLADIDGDGRADYVGISQDGKISGWRNAAVDNSPPTAWTPFRGIASGLSSTYSPSRWKFADLNGDHKDDLLYVNENGRVETFINMRGLNAGLGPVWKFIGVTHAGASSPVNVTFGRIMGTGRADYATISDNPTTGNVYATINKNMGKGGTAVRGDGTRYCDMTGSGSDDYIWISLMGEITVYGNNHKWGTWTQYGVVYNVNRSRREVYFADFDGNKRCDILLVDKATGATTVLRNDFANGKFVFTNIGVVTGTATCQEGYGYDLHDLGVRWNDVDGDGRADFLCMQSNGQLYGYLNKGVNNMVNQGQIKHTEGKERKSLRLADINGDGRDDLVHVDLVDSTVTAWSNDGATGQFGDDAAGTSAFRWVLKGQVSPATTSRGSCVEFANINGIGRADSILIYPDTNQQFVKLNTCPGLTPVEPNLPTPPAMTYP